MEINDGKLKKLMLVLAAILAIEIAASFYTYGSIWHLADPMQSHLMDWVWYVSLVIYGTLLVAILILVVIMAVVATEDGVIFLASIAVLMFAWLAARLVAWPGIVWIEEQTSLIIPNARIAWSVILGGYLGILCLCLWWLSGSEKKTG